MKKIIVATIAFCAAMGCANAQNLNKEITIEKDYTPVERKAVKKNSLPQSVKLDFTAPKLSYSDWAAPVTVPADFPVMLPFGYKTSHDFSEHRGYLMAGAGSQLNIGVNAGYRIVDSDKTDVGIWLSYNSTWTGRNSSPRTLVPDAIKPEKQKYNSNKLGIDLRNNFKLGTLTLNLLGHIDNFNYYGLSSSASAPMQLFSQFAIDAAWKSAASNHSDFSYSAAINFNHSGFSKASYEINPIVGGDASTNPPAVSENDFRLKLGGEYRLGVHNSVGLDATLNLAMFNHNQLFVSTSEDIYAAEKKSIGMFSVSPYLMHKGDNMLLRLGANLDVSFKDGAALRFSPNVKFEYAFGGGIGFYLNATGGKRINRQSDVFAVARYLNPSCRVPSSYTPIDGEIGFKFGPFTGFYAKVFGGYGITKDALVPYSLIQAESGKTFTQDFIMIKPMDLKGLKMGVELGYKYRSLVELNAKLTFAPQSFGKGYVLGFDLPKYVANASVKVNPIEKLSVELGYELRGNRMQYCDLIHPTGGPREASKVSLGNVNNLKLGAKYQLNDGFAVFLQANNLLNKQWDLVCGMGEQKLNIFAGVNLNF